MIKEPTLKKLRNKLLIINVISLTLVISIAFSLIYLNFYNRTQAEIEKSLLQIPRDVHENAALSNQNTARSERNDSSRGDSGRGNSNRGDNLTIRGEGRIPVDYSKSFVVNIAADGEITVFSMLNIDNSTYINAIEYVLNRGSSSGVAEFAHRTWRFNIDQGPNAGASYVYSIVFLDIDDTNRGLNALAASLVIIGIIAIGAIFIVSMMIANRAIRPVEESMMRQKRFVADASHELKTPIAVIAANAEAASGVIYEAEKEGSGEDSRFGKSPGIAYWIDNITDETARMNELVDNLLSLTKAEEKKADHYSFDLAQAVSEEADRVEAFLFEKNISFDLAINTPMDVPAVVISDKIKVQAILSVLLENAVKYTPEGGQVILTVGKNNVSVSNTGLYIPPEDLAHIFDRFFRADPSRNSETGGHGIGLSIAKEISDALGCELKAESVLQEDGSAVNTFTLSLPV